MSTPKWAEGLGAQPVDAAAPKWANGLNAQPARAPELPSASPAVATDAGGPRMDAALQGFGQGASFGFLPWLQAQAERGIRGAEGVAEGFKRVDIGQAASGLEDVARSAIAFTPLQHGLSALGGVGVIGKDESLGPLRAQWAARDKELKTASPGSYGAGSLAGSIMNPLTLKMGAGAAAAKTIGQAIGQGARLGAATGLIQGAGESTSEGLSSDDAAARLAIQTGGGALGGGIGGGAVHGAGKLLGQVKNGLLAPLVARYMGLNKGVANKLEKTGTLPDVIQQGVDSGVIRSLSGLESTASRNEALKSSIGGELDDIYAKLTAAGATPTGAEVADVYRKMMVDAVSRGEGSSAAPLASKLDDFIGATKSLQSRGVPGGVDSDEAAKFALAYPMELKSVSELAKQPLGKAKADELAKIPTRQPSASVKTLSDAYTKLKQFIEQKASDASPELSSALTQTNRKYGMAQDLAAMLEDKGARDSANKNIQFSTIAAPLLGGALGGGKAYYDDPTGISTAGGVLAGIAGGAAIAGAPGRAAAVGGYKAANAMQTALQSRVAPYLGQLGGAALGEMLAPEPSGATKNQNPEPQQLPAYSQYIMGNQPAQRGDEQEAQDAFRKNR